MQKLALKDITVSNKYLRLATDVETLIESIKAVGLINPLSVNKNNELLAGGRRYSAVKKLGWVEVPVTIVDRSSLEQELISIDENIVRTPLNKLELENAFNRGREIYEQINPGVEKIELEIKELTPEEKKEEKQKEEEDETSYAAITAQKTGLSKSVIKSAIRRDALSSDEIKKARSNGELSASQVNEIIRLTPQEQEDILPHIQDKTVKDVRKIVTQLRKAGTKSAIDFSNNMQTAPREVIDLIKAAKKINKAISKLVVEDIDYEGKEMNILEKELLLLKSLLGGYLNDGYIPTNESVQESAQGWQ